MARRVLEKLRAKKYALCVWPLMCCKNFSCVPRFFTVGRAAGAMRQMLVQGHNLRLLDEAASRSTSSTRDPENRIVSTSSVDPGDLALSC